jgi:putative NADH-flavin reductase
MSTIAIIGGTGYTGGNLANEAVSRGHHVISFSRNPAAAPIDGVDYQYGASAEATRVVPGADAVVATLSPRGDSVGTLLATYQALAAAVMQAGSRLIVVGGFSSLRPEAGAPRFADGDVPEQFAVEAREMEAIRGWLAEQAPADLDWTFVSPAGAYGAHTPGERSGRYRVGGEVALFDADGKSEISGADFAVAIIDEIDQPAHRREHISIAY